MIPDQIERVALIGWHVYPASTYSKAACITDPTDHATCDLDAIDDWCKRFPGCNWRVVFGPSNLWGLDCDAPPLHEDGITAMAQLVAANSPLPSGPRMRSGGGGLGVFFRWSGEPIEGKTSYPKPGIDPRRGRQSQMIPPSIHVVTGRPYRWLVAPWEVSPPDAPRWLLDIMAPPPPPEPRPSRPLPDGDTRRRLAIGWLQDAVATVATAGKGTRNDTLNRQVYSMARLISDGTLTENEVRDCMLAGARACAIPIREAMLTIESGLRARRS